MAAVESGNVRLLNTLALLADADELGYLIGEDLNDLLMELLEKSSMDNYAGTRPPQKSYLQIVEGADLYAFSIDETSLNGPVYYKFSLVDGVLYLVSLHKDRK